MSIKVAALQLEANDLADARQAFDHTIGWLEKVAQEHAPDLIVTPECTYPAYVLGTLNEFKAHYPGDPLPRFAEIARRYKLHLCIGLATPAERNGEIVLYNEAVLLGPDGDIIGRTAKSLLWHFDNKWFCAGTEYAVFETALGKIGMLICADGRQPEIARSLALGGAQIILDPTCWVTYGTNQAALGNPQADFMLATRAWENGVWCLAADKIGIERGSVLYAGRSSIIAPDGKKVAEAPSDKEVVIVVEIPEMPQKASQLSARRPELYGDLTLPTETLPVHAILQEPLVPAKSILRVAVAQYPPFDSTQAMGEVVRSLTAQLARESADIVVLPDLAHGLNDNAAWRGDLVFPFYRSLSKQSGVAILATAWEQEGSKRYKTARLFHNGVELGMWRQTHFALGDEPGWTPGDEIGGIVKLPGGSSARLGVMLGADGYHPEVARILMLRGADIILWPTRPNLPANAQINLTAVARSRAAENRVGLAVATPMEFSSGLDLYGGTGRGHSMVVDSYGAVVAPCLPEHAMAASAQLSVSASREKMRAPGTDVVYSRLPHCYARLTAAD